MKTTYNEQNGRNNQYKTGYSTSVATSSVYTCKSNISMSLTNIQFNTRGQHVNKQQHGCAKNCDVG